MFLEDTRPPNLPRSLAVFREAIKAGGRTMPAEHSTAGIPSTKGYTLHPGVVISRMSTEMFAGMMNS